jgi:predicted phosphodiesterase
VHGTPTRNTHYRTEERPDSFASKMMRSAGVREGDLIAFGRTHKPWHRIVEGVNFVTTGSGSKPKDADWRAGFVIIRADEKIENVQFVRVE